ncbi:hypothetical protein QTO34_000858 [Cnephaeus nilssonii]|uniref:Small acidic protein-like domain-containing protein n=1 Tax=Cnephaeus nilssonii TaxID=3371016 RepID=A0AA40ICF5_CNENI|nr:hypothetical protein QTO34_000858 [Eptesicus nilssonii]
MASQRPRQYKTGHLVAAKPMATRTGQHSWVNSQRERRSLQQRSIQVFFFGTHDSAFLDQRPFPHIISKKITLESQANEKDLMKDCGKQKVAKHPGHTLGPPGIPSFPRKERRKESKVAELWKEEPDTDFEVVLEKKGNMDKAHIDQVRRNALQEETDRESGKTEASGTQTWTGTQFGQCDTAGFENEEQKLKFLKLMGGFKNLSPSFSRTPDTTRRPNMALDTMAASSLQQSLQQDYVRVLSWKHGGRAGLGLPTSNKVFYIDRNAFKSIKFED